ncbi:MAG: sensor histidine kinase [Spirochaetota bacterium]
MDFLTRHQHMFIAGFTAGASLLSAFGYLHYRDPALMVMGAYALLSTSVALLAAFGVVLPHALDIILHGGFVYLLLSMGRIILNLSHYSTPFYQTFQRLRTSLLLFAITSAVVTLFYDTLIVYRITQVLCSTSQVAAHIFLAFAVKVCARKGHTGTRYMSFSQGTWLFTIALIIGVRNRPMPDALVFSHADSDYRLVLFMETVLLGAAVLYRLSQQYQANQKILADLIFAESTQADYRSLLIEMRENFKSVTTSNIEGPARLLTERISAMHDALPALPNEHLLRELKILAQNLFSNIQILVREDFQPNRPTPVQKTKRPEIALPLATGKVALWSGTEIVAIGYRNILRNAGFQAILVEKPESLPTFVETMPDLNLVLLACGTEEDLGSAIAYCGQIRSVKLRTELPVIVVLPTLNIPGQITSFFAAGASDVFSKFLSEEEIIARVKVNVEYSEMAMQLKAWHTDLESRIKHDTEQLRLQGRMNPHFLFNSLNTIYSLLNHNTESAQKAVLLLSDICRFYLEFSYESLIPLALEWEFTRNYLELAKMRYGTFLKVLIRDPAESAVGIQIPPLSLQPLVENGIKHGLTEQEREAQLTVVCRVMGDGAEITIEDNGAGIHKVDNSRSLGNIKKRLKFYYHHVELRLANRAGGGALCTLNFSGRRPG